jgi:cysteine desulfurase
LKKYSIDKKRAYLDFAAATPIDENVAKAMHDADEFFANPSAQYESARKAKEILTKARKECAMFLQCSSDEIIFTSGATESNNIAIQGVVLAHRTGRIISVATEHSSVIGPLNYLSELGYDVVYAPISNKGLVDLDSFANLLNEDTVLVTISYANSEIGTVQPITKISQIIKAYNASRGSNIILHTDASAGALTLSCDVSRLGVDLLSLGGAKVYGPKSAGLLYKMRGVELKPIIYGGSQENCLRPGTESIGMAVGMAKALSMVKQSRKKDSVHFKNLHQLLFAELDRVSIKYIYNGHPKDKIYNVASISVDGQNGEDLVARLDALGFEVATGAACEASSDEPSRALMALGRTKSEAQGSLRISLGRTTSEGEIKRFVDALSGIIRP